MFNARNTNVPYSFIWKHDILTQNHINVLCWHSDEWGYDCAYGKGYQYIYALVQDSGPSITLAMDTLHSCDVNALRPRTKWPPFSRRRFQMHFHEWKRKNFDYDFTEVCSQSSNQKYRSIGSDNGLVPTSLSRRPHGKPISQLMMIILLMHIFATRPQWVHIQFCVFISAGMVCPWPNHLVLYRFRISTMKNMCTTTTCSLQWRQNDHDDVSNHQPHGCLPNRLFRRR